ncbi:hypothetical protein BJY04DRAFT_66845 [Aspergillus karnatakaensis]|uniref:uncharacterized protein n=1 Tax=Aspergillus karnatakaensis TaxID=1810916 RepID=UPI003CCE3892
MPRACPSISPPPLRSIGNKLIKQPSTSTLVNPVPELLVEPALRVSLNCPASHRQMGKLGEPARLVDVPFFFAGPDCRPKTLGPFPAPTPRELLTFCLLLSVFICAASSLSLLYTPLYLLLIVSIFCQSVNNEPFARRHLERPCYSETESHRP